MSHPQPSVGGVAPGTTVASAVPTDLPSAQLVILAAAQSGAGIVRLTTQAGTAAEVGALALLTGNAGAVGPEAAVVLNAALGSALTSVSTWGDAVTAVAGS